MSLERDLEILPSGCKNSTSQSRFWLKRVLQIKAGIEFRAERAALSFLFGQWPSGSTTRASFSSVLGIASFEQIV